MEEEILRRVFQLSYLSSVRYANYRQVNNVKNDYDYVCIKRKTIEKILFSIVDQPGRIITYNEVEQVIERWNNISMSTGSYQLDELGGQLICLEDQPILKPVMMIETCRNQGFTRISFLVAFMKHYIPDLLGERQVQSFNKESFQENPMKLIACDAGRQQEIMNILAHYLTCSYCNTR